jgi:hypothetical protein
MQTILRTVAALPFVIASVSASMAAAPTCSNTNVPPNSTYWDGRLQVYKQSLQCTVQYFNRDDSGIAHYRPYLAAGNAPSAFTSFLGNNHAMVIHNQSATGQFGGTGNYLLCGISDLVQSSALSGNFNFTQTPPSVTSSTDFVTLDGFINNYAGETGCKLYFRGIFVRRAPSAP